MAASAAEPPEVMVPTFELTVCPVVATEAVHELSVKWSFFVSAPPWLLALPALPWFPGLPVPPWISALLVLPLPHAPGPVPLHGSGPPSLDYFCSASAPPPSWTYWVLFCVVKASGATLRGGGGGGLVMWGFGVLSHVPVFMSLY